MPKPQLIYGGPYASEADAITAENEKKKPNFDKLIEKWPTITQGAHDYIEKLKKDEKPFEGNFSENVVVDYDKEDDYIPEVADFDQYKEKAEEIMDKANAEPGPDQPEAKENPHVNVEDEEVDRTTPNPHISDENKKRLEEGLKKNSDKDKNQSEFDLDKL